MRSTPAFVANPLPFPHLGPEQFPRAVEGHADDAAGGVEVEDDLSVHPLEGEPADNTVAGPHRGSEGEVGGIGVGVIGEVHDLKVASISS